MLEVAAGDGISGIVATPHILKGLYEGSRRHISEAISGIRDLSGSIDIYPGAEVRLDLDFRQRLENDELPLINNKRFLLLELPPYLIPPIGVLENIVAGLKAKELTPIFSHPERNLPIAKDLSIMKRLIGSGALFQLTAMSILDRGEIGRSALRMIRKNYVHVVASDAHDSKMRPPVLSDSYEYVSNNFGRDLAKKLFSENPLKIIHGEHVV